VYLNLSTINIPVVVMKTSATWTTSTIIMLSATIKVKTFGWIVVGQSTLCFCFCFGFATCCRWKRFSLTVNKQTTTEKNHTTPNSTELNSTELNWAHLWKTLFIFIVGSFMFCFAFWLFAFCLLHLLNFTLFVIHRSNEGQFMIISGKVDT